MNTESKRQQRYAGVLQQDIADIFQKEGSNLAQGAFITITRVRVTPDFSIARVYLSFLDAAKSDDALKSIRARSSEIRYKLGTRIRDHVRIIPQLEFFKDDTNEYVARMDKLFEGISKESRQPDDDQQDQEQK